MMSTFSLSKTFQIISTRLSEYQNLISEDMRLPDFKGRHLFTVRLRIILFISMWVVIFIFFPAIFKVAPFVPIIFNACFFVTTLCYFHVIRYNRVVLSVMIFEVFADVISQTVVIYVMGHDGWAPFFIYGLYVAAAGILSGYHSALIASTAVMICYYVLFVLVQSGIIPVFEYPHIKTGVINLQDIKTYINLFILPFLLVLVVYSVKIANFFSRIKQQALERRNIQLTALNHIGSTIRRVLNVHKVINEVLKGVIQGLGFEVCILALVDKEANKINFYLPQDNYYTQRLEEILGHKYSEMYLPLNAHRNSAYMAIQRNRILVRNNFTELMFGVEPQIPMHNTLRAQKTLGFKKFVITPLVAEQRVIGVIIGASKKPYVDDVVIDTLEHFSNQAALAIESSQLIGTLEKKNKELLEANKVKSDFLAVMSHELRTPLNAVIGYTESLLDKTLGDLNKDQSHSLTEVLRNGKNLLELINSILDLAKIESGKMSLNLDELDIIELVENIKTSVQPLIDKKKHTFTIHAQKNMPHIQADGVKLRQILMNLIGNAIKFTNSNGEIDVFLEYHENTEDLYHSEFSKENITEALADSPAFLIRVRDTGIGIKEEDLKSIFELFRQADSSYTRAHEGTGLGLALTKELVNLHSGFIIVKSHYGKGTEFEILLPQMLVHAS